MSPRLTGTPDRTPVLFIGCAGRSGSTLLDRVLGAHEGFCSTGEIRFIWERGFAQNQLCGCGQPFQDCGFWSGVSRALFASDPAHADIDAGRLLRAALDETRQAPWLLQRHVPAAHRAAITLYTGLLERLYAAILASSAERVVVDSSGDGTHGLILAKAPNVALHVIHLIRDPRAVAFSWKRQRRRVEIHWANAEMPIETARTSATRWAINNLLVERLAPLAASYRRVRYEDFVADPDAALRQILEPHRSLINGTSSPRATELVLAPTHTVSGNPMRFRQGPVAIKLDDEWRGALCRRERRTIEAITLPLLLRYRYPLSLDG